MSNSDQVDSKTLENREKDDDILVRISKLERENQEMKERIRQLESDVAWASTCTPMW